jgi:hypothetical protein
MAYYEFVTVWRVSAPIEATWNEIYRSELWPSWWKGVESVVETHSGDEGGIGTVRRYTWKSQLPYKLTFDSRQVRVEPPFVLEALVSGELEGSGLWRLTREGDGTVARYDWKVRATQPWMQMMTPLARPVFRWNHNIIMGWGSEGLSKRLGVKVDAQQTD